MNVIFDLWIDVQRRWVYLEGIFTGSADLPHLLPQETQRFASISSEFLNLMKKVARAPLVLDVIPSESLLLDDMIVSVVAIACVWIRQMGSTSGWVWTS